MWFKCYLTKDSKYLRQVLPFPFPHPQQTLSVEYRTEPVWCHGPFQAAITNQSKLACEGKPICHLF